MKENNPRGNYPPGVGDNDIDRAWGEERPRISEKDIEHRIEYLRELELLREIDRYEEYGNPPDDEFDNFDP